MIDTLIPGLEFRQPYFLIAALSFLPVYLLARRAPGRVLFSSFRLLPRTGASWRTRFAWIPDVLLAASALAMGIALAGPRIGDKHSRIEREGIAIMMVVDISSSMKALDLSTEDRERTRLDAVRDVFKEFVTGSNELSGRPDDAIGIVSFAGYADTRCPLTLDHNNLTMVANSLAIVEEANEDGTALGDGLGLAVERLHKSKAKSKVAILLTDGVNNAGEESPLAAAELAKTKGIKVYTIGAGTNGMAPMRVRDPFSGQMVLRGVPVRIDETTLKSIAERTNGRYFRATDAEGLRAVYQEIDRLETTRQTEESYREYREYFPHVLGLALLVALLGFLARGTVFRRLP